MVSKLQKAWIFHLHPQCHYYASYTEKASSHTGCCIILIIISQALFQILLILKILSFLQVVNSPKFPVIRIKMFI